MPYNCTRWLSRSPHRKHEATPAPKGLHHTFLDTRATVDTAQDRLQPTSQLPPEIPTDFTGLSCVTSKGCVSQAPNLVRFCGYRRVAPTSCSPIWRNVGTRAGVHRAPSIITATHLYKWMLKSTERAIVITALAHDYKKGLESALLQGPNLGYSIPAPPPWRGSRAWRNCPQYVNVLLGSSSLMSGALDGWAVAR
jgi:hypothetical protein